MATHITTSYNKLSRLGQRCKGKYVRPIKVSILLANDRVYSIEGDAGSTVWCKGRWRPEANASALRYLQASTDLVVDLTDIWRKILQKGGTND